MERATMDHCDTREKRLTSKICKSASAEKIYVYHCVMVYEAVSDHNLCRIISYCIAFKRLQLATCFQKYDAQWFVGVIFSAMSPSRADESFVNFYKNTKPRFNIALISTMVCSRVGCASYFAP